MTGSASVSTPAAPRVALFAVVVVSTAIASGCFGSAKGSASVEQAKVAIRDFLEAIKRGDDPAARNMLTRLARAKTAEMGISIAPPVAPTATYSIREGESIGDSDEIVHVATTWTDTDADGFSTTDEVVWVTRLEPEGWRVVGMAMKVFEDSPPLLLDFEDPEDMIAKQKSVAMEIQKRAKASAGSDAVRTGNAKPAKTVE